MNINCWVELISAFSLVTTPLALICYRCAAQKIEKKSLGFSRGTLRFGGLMMLLPLIVILTVNGALTGPEVGTLIGAIVGYLLSGLADKEKKGGKNEKPTKI